MSSVISVIAPETPLKRYIYILISICIIWAALGPIGELVSTLESGDIDILSGTEIDEDYESVYRETLISGNEKSFCELLKAKMGRELGLDEDSFDVYADMCVSDGEYKLDSLAVALYGKSVMQDPARIRSYTRSLVGVECEIIYG